MKERGPLTLAAARAVVRDIEAVLVRHDVELLVHTAPDRLRLVPRRRETGFHLLSDAPTGEGVDVQVVPLGESIEHLMETLVGGAVRAGHRERRDDARRTSE